MWIIWICIQIHLDNVEPSRNLTDSSCCFRTWAPLVLRSRSCSMTGSRRRHIDMHILGSSSVEKEKGKIKQIRREQVDTFHGVTSGGAWNMFSLLLALKGAVISFLRRGSWSPRLLMTSITAYLTALAHSSSKQRVLQANIQTSTGDTDVCGKKCSMSVFNRQRSERCEHSPNFTLQWNYLNSCDAGVDVMSFAGLLDVNSQRSQ